MVEPRRRLADTTLAGTRAARHVAAHPPPRRRRGNGVACAARDAGDGAHRLCASTRWGDGVRRFLLGVCALAVLTAGCGASGSTSSPATGSPTRPAASPSSIATASLVGRWQRVLRCEQLVGDLDEAGLHASARYAWLGQTSSDGQSSYRSGSPSPTAAHPCVGAVARKHSHFFASGGEFGSLDWLGGQVDDGQYTLVGGNAVRIGSVTFHYQLKDANTLALSPLLTKAMMRTALAHPKDFSDALWAISVAYPGHTWTRVDCRGWC